jgi:molybdenum cofactor biosynthesis enzyme MoaA
MFEICGTWGDPIMSKDIGKITKYIMDNSQAEVHINTNGGMRTPSWWEDLGNYCGKRLTVYFDVDGTTNEMHQKYRRGVDLQTVLDNMEALSSTKANTKAFTILFKHNQDYVHDIKDMCMMYGAEFVHIIKSDRFLTTSKFPFINENGKEDVLESITKDLNHVIKNPWINKATDNAKNRRKLGVTINDTLKGQQDDKGAYER